MDLALEKNVISLVHFMAYPGPGATRSVTRGEGPEEYLLSTIKKVLDDPYFGGIEITRINDPKIRKKVAELLASSGKEVGYAAQSTQTVNVDKLIPSTDISSLDEGFRVAALERLKGYLAQAYELGATQFAFVSGADPGSYREREEALKALARSIDELHRYNYQLAEELNREPMVLTLETFDRIDDCRNQLLGPSDEAIDLVRVVRDVYGHKTFGLMYDLSHMPMIKGISLDAETPEVLYKLAPYLNHIHIGTCVLDPADPLYGDSHPRFGYSGGVVTEEMLAEFVKALQAIGYSKGIGFEVSPHGRDQSDDVVAEAKVWFDRARNRIDVNYAMGSYFFLPSQFFPAQIFNMITDARVERNEIIVEAAKARKRREKLTNNGRLLISAADHPARNVTNVGANPIAMGNRLEYLSRILRVVICGEVDGLMATSDIIEDLFIIDYFLRERGHESFLDNKLLIGSVNRTGLAGIKYELDDRLSSISVERMVELGMDGAKMMFRLEHGEYSRDSINTIMECVKAIDQCNAHDLPVFLEPLPVEKTEQGFKVILEAEALIKTMGIASALGGSSKGLWLKIPYVANYAQVARATTLPILMLGGESKGDPTYTMEAFERGMAEGANVRGAMVGRNVIYPGKDDPGAVSAAISKIIHEGYSTLEAVRYMSQRRGMEMDWLTGRILG